MSRVACRVLAIAVGVLEIASCEDGRSMVEPKPVVTAVTVSGAPTDGVILVGDTLNLSATTRDGSGQVLSGRAVLWSSTSPAVASVSNQGTVSAVSAGTTTIRATSEGVFGDATLSVRVAIPAPAPGATQVTVQTVLGGKVSISIPPDALPASVTRLTVGPAAAPPASAELVNGTAFDFGPSGTHFSTPLLLTLRFDAGSVSSADLAGLAIYHAIDGDYTEVQGSIVDKATNEVSAPISSFSSYAILRRAAPVSVAVAGGNNQTTTVKTPVPVSPTVRVTDSRGRPVRFAQVSFAVVSGGGSITGATQTTDSTGTASVGSWTLGPAVGSNSLAASVVGLPAVTFTAAGSAAAPARLVYTAQPVSTTAGAPFPDWTVTVQDAFNNIATTFNGTISLTLSGGPAAATLNGSTTAISVAGVATFSGLNIRRPGTGYTVVASTTGLASATSSRFDIAPGPATRLSLVSGGNQSALVGTKLGEPIVVQVTDALDNPVVASSVLNFAVNSGGGSVAPASVTTDASGRASTSWTLGSLAGLQSVLVTSSALPALTVTATGIAQNATRLTLVSGGGQFAQPGNPLPAPIVVKVVDANGFAVAGETVTFSVTSGGGYVTPVSAISDAQGLVSTHWTLGTGNTQSLTAITSNSPSPLIIGAAAVAFSGANVTISTTGTDLDDAFSLFVSVCPNGTNNSCYSGPTINVGPNTSVWVNLDPGTYLFYLLDVASNCTVQSPQSVTVPIGATTNVAFNVTCARGGTIQVTAPTTGADPDDAYVVLLDGNFAGNLAAGQSLSVLAAAGSHSVGLGDVAGNCTVAGPNPVQAVVTTGAVTNIAFPVSCGTNPTLRVTVTTTGSNIPTGYTVGLDLFFYYFLYTFAAPANGVASNRIPPGSYVVYLANVPSNCSFSGASSANIVLTLGGTVDVAFSLTCR